MKQDSYLNSEYAKMMFKVFRPYFHDLHPDADIASLPEAYVIRMFEENILPQNILQNILLPKLQSIVDAQKSYQSYSNKLSKAFVQVIVNEESRLERDYVGSGLPSPWFRQEDFTRAGNLLVVTALVDDMTRALTKDIIMSFRPEVEGEHDYLLGRTPGHLAITLRSSLKNFMSLNYATNYAGNNDCLPTIQKDLEDFLKDIEETVKLIQPA